MSLASDCGCPCPTSEIIEVPGTEGAAGTAGAAGTDGVNAFTVTSADFTVPAIGGNVTILVTDSTWAVVGMNVTLGDGLQFSVASKPAATSMILMYLDYAVNVNTGNNVVSGTGVSPGGFQIVVANPGALTDNTTGAASNTLAAGVGDTTISFYINLANLTNADILTTFTLGYKFKILAVSFAVETAVTTINKLATITPKISGVATTGGVLSLTSANCTPKGTVVAATAVTAANTGSNAATISLTASAVTAFVEGTGWILIRVQNMDSADAVASLASKVNTLISALTT